MRLPPAGLRRADVAAVFELLTDVSNLPFEHAYPPELVARVGELIPAAHVVYRENDLQGRRTPRMVDAVGVQVDDADEQYWTVGPCAITTYRARTGDLSAVRLSDVVSWRRYRESAVYREYFHPSVDSMLDLALQVGNGWQRSLLFCRDRGERDFSERDRSVLELLRPHLRSREARVDLYRRMTAVSEDPPSHRIGNADPRLTPREREIVMLVASGKTNAQIASDLWLSPATVKKHLENVYEKLGVGSRAAAASRLMDEFRVN